MIEAVREAKKHMGNNGESNSKKAKTNPKPKASTKQQPDEEVELYLEEEKE